MTHGDVARRGRHGDEGLKIGREGLQPIYDFIDSTGGKPFLVWYAPFLPHPPHTPPDRLLKKYQAPGLAAAVARYYAMIEWFHETVGQLLDHLDRKALRENTIVLYLADNGWIQSPDGQPPQPTRAKMSPYDAGIRTPVIVRWPGSIEAARDEKTLVGSIDVMPTLLHAAGITPSSDLPGIARWPAARPYSALYSSIPLLTWPVLSPISSIVTPPVRMGGSSSCPLPQTATPR